MKAKKFDADALNRNLMMSLAKCLIVLSCLLVLSGCTEEANPGAPRAPLPSEVKKIPGATTGTPTPKSLPEIRKELAEKKARQDAAEAAAKAAQEGAAPAATSPASQPAKPAESKPATPPNDKTSEPAAPKS